MKARVGIRRSQRGVSIIESVLGIVAIVLLLLFFIDVGAVVTCQTNNERMCKNAVRAASQKDKETEARLAAEEIIKNTPSSQIFTSPTMEEFSYDTSTGLVSARTMVTCNLPVPVPGIANLTQVQMQAKSVETIVAILAE
jgi:Flp pilus assembly protein TadG